MPFPHRGQGGKAGLIRDRRERQGRAFLVFVERRTSRSRMAHKPLEDTNVSGAERREGRGDVRGSVGPGLRGYASLTLKGMEDDCSVLSKGVP